MFAFNVRSLNSGQTERATDNLEPSWKSTDESAATCSENKFSNYYPYESSFYQHLCALFLNWLLVRLNYYGRFINIEWRISCCYQRNLNRGSVNILLSERSHHTFIVILFTPGMTLLPNC